MPGTIKLLVLIQDGETKSHLARHPAFDRTVIFHLLPKPGAPERVQLDQYLEKLSIAGNRLLLERGDDNGAAYVVTERIPDFRSLREWLEKVVSAPAAPETRVAGAAVTPAGPVPGEFTRLFQAPASPATPPQQTPAQPAAPGEFTRLFSAHEPGVQPPAAEMSAPVSSPPAPKKQGAFTKAFLALSDTDVAAAPEAPPVSPPQPSTANPGEFTRLFRSPSTPSPEPMGAVQPPIAPPETPSRSAAQQGGEYTRMFGGPAVPLQTPQAQGTAVAMPSVDRFPPFSAPPIPAAPAVPALPSTPAAAPSAIVQKAPSSNRSVFLILAVLAVAAVCLVAYFALKR